MKILYVTTVSETMPFFDSHIKMLLEEGHTVDMACRIGKPISQELLDLGCTAYNIEFDRSPLKISNYSAYKNLKKLLLEKEYDIVHTHTPVASVLARLACKNIEKIRLIYTAHGFHFYNGGPLINWLIYYPIERWLSKYTDVLITINKEDFKRANNSFKAAKVEYIPGVGIDSDKFSLSRVDKFIKRRELGIPNDVFVLLSVGELNENKNHETILKAIGELDNLDICYIICGVGHKENDLKSLSNELGISNRVRFLGYREDINEICIASDVFIFPSYREGLSVALMEAMACGLPVICSNIRGNNDLIKENQGGYLINPRDTKGFTMAIKKIKGSLNTRQTFKAYNMNTVKQFNVESILNQIKIVYRSIGQNINK